MFSDRTDWRTAECAGEMQFFEALNHTRICYLLQQSYPVKPAYINWDGWKVNDVCKRGAFGFLARAQQTGCTIGGHLPPWYQGAAMTSLSLSISHHRPYHFNHFSTFGPQAGFPPAVTRGEKV